MPALLRLLLAAFCSAFTGARMASYRLQRLLTAAEAAAIDATLMTPSTFSLDSLMEIAGQGCAFALAREYPNSKVLVVAGPGNNGGDAIVAARWLVHFGHPVVHIVYPKRPGAPGPDDKPATRLYRGNLNTAIHAGAVLLDTMPEHDAIRAGYDVILDGVFGFSFKGAIRAPFDSILTTMATVAEYGPALNTADTAAAVSAGGDSTALSNGVCRQARRASGVAIVSIDVPSGWDVDDGPVPRRDTTTAEGTGQTRTDDILMPSMVVSLTWPKGFAARLDPCVRHWLSGRFVPPGLARQYGLELDLKRAWGANSTDIAVKLQ